MTVAGAKDPPPSPPRAGRVAEFVRAARDSLPMATLLATVITIYLLPGLLLQKWPGALAAALSFVGAWLGHFTASYVMLAMVIGGYRRARHGAGPSPGRLALLAFASGIAAAILYAGVVFVTQGPRVLNSFNGVLLWSCSLATLIVLAHHYAERSRSAAAALRDAELRRIGLERELAGARLALLQAQVEPHFIFNALANVRRLLRTDADAARTLLADLLRYLEEALPTLRGEMTTLGREAELVRAYLAVHQVRMGERLRFEIDIPVALADHPVPPMLLLTLVENALKHGLQPMVDGGKISISARAGDGRITIAVADTGRGMGSGSGHGTGLANVRARLKQTYGAGAGLALAVNEPQGVVATITLPSTR
jgi:signal transduction histidine kinase